MRYGGERGAQGGEGGWMRGRGYVGQFSRNSMGRDRHSNPRYPRSTLSGSCSLFKQASNSILGSYPFSLALTPFRFAFLFVSSPFCLARSLVFPISLSRYPSFCGSRISHPVFHCPSHPQPLFRGAPNSNPRTVLRDFNSCDNYLDFSCATGSDGSIVSL